MASGSSLCLSAGFGVKGQARFTPATALAPCCPHPSADYDGVKRAGALPDTILTGLMMGFEIEFFSAWEKTQYYFLFSCIVSDSRRAF